LSGRHWLTVSQEASSTHDISSAQRKAHTPGWKSTLFHGDAYICAEDVTHNLATSNSLTIAETGIPSVRQTFLLSFSSLQKIYGKIKCIDNVRN